MKKLRPACQTLKQNIIFGWAAERKSKPENTSALHVVSTVVAHGAAATNALDDAFKMRRLDTDHHGRAATMKEQFRMHHQRYGFSGQQPAMEGLQTSRGNH